MTNWFSLERGFSTKEMYPVFMVRHPQSAGMDDPRREKIAHVFLSTRQVVNKPPCPSPRSAALAARRLHLRLCPFRRWSRYQQRKGAMFNFTDPLLVVSSLFFPLAKVNNLHWVSMVR